MSAKFFYSVEKRAWILTNRDDKEIIRFTNDKDSKPTSITVGGGSSITKVMKVSGTLPLVNVATNGISVATITNTTDVAIGDLVFVTPKSALAAAVALDSAWVPTTGVVCVKLSAPQITTCGSQPAVGVDLTVIRF